MQTFILARSEQVVNVIIGMYDLNKSNKYMVAKEDLAEARSTQTYRQICSWIDSLISDNQRFDPQWIGVIDFLNPSRLSAAIVAGWEPLIAMIILSFPEVLWKFGSINGQNSLEVEEKSIWSDIEDAHIISTLKQMTYYRIPLFDPTGLRDWIRWRTNITLVKLGDDMQLPRRQKESLAASIDDELSYAYLHAHAAYRFGCRADVIISWRSMEDRFSTKQGELGVGHGYWLLLEDMSLNFPDHEGRGYLLNLESRAIPFNKLDSTKPHIENSKLRAMVTTGQSGFQRDVQVSNEKYLKDYKKINSSFKVVIKPHNGIFDLWRQLQWPGMDHITLRPQWTKKCFYNLTGTLSERIFNDPLIKAILDIRHGLNNMALGCFTKNNSLLKSTLSSKLSPTGSFKQRNLQPDLHYNLMPRTPLWATKDFGNFKVFLCGYIFNDPLIERAYVLAFHNCKKIISHVKRIISNRFFHPGNYKKFNWPPEFQSNILPTSNPGGHGAPGRLLLLAETLLQRSNGKLETTYRLEDTIYGAVLSTDALEYTGLRTPTTAIDAMALKHIFELQAECKFCGVAYRIALKPRLAEIRDTIKAASRWLPLRRRNVASLNAEMHIISRLLQILRNNLRFDEEQECLNTLRVLRLNLWMNQKRLARTLPYFIARYAVCLISSPLIFLFALFIWTFVLSALFYFARSYTCPVSWQLRFGQALIEAFTSLFSVGSPIHLYKELGIPIDGQYEAVVCLAILLGFVHLGIFVSYVYTLISRR